jgi:formylglycine-generating enzyme required for sulfatase activity
MRLLQPRAGAALLDSPFAPFDGRPVLKGASAATAASMVHPRYRNYFTAERNDIFAGFRSVAV